MKILLEKKTDLMVNEKGFSLLEVLLALFVLSIGLLGALTLMSNSMAISKEARDLVTASHLSQEGAELVRWLRDNNNATTGANSFDNLPDGLGCRADLTLASGGGPGTLDCNSSSGFDSGADFLKYKLYFKETAGLLSYSHDSTGGISTLSKFSRRIYLEHVSSDVKAVNVFVFWGPDWSSLNIPTEDNCILQNKCVHVVSELADWKSPG